MKKTFEEIKEGDKVLNSKKGEGIVVGKGSRGSRQWVEVRYSDKNHTGRTYCKSEIKTLNFGV